MSDSGLRTLVAVAVLSMSGWSLCSADAGADSPYLVRGDSWAETMLASRARFQTTFEPEDVTVGPWFATLPIPAETFADSQITLETIDLAARSADGAPVWMEHPKWTDGAVHQLPGVDFASSYLYRTIHTAAPAALIASFGSDDGLEVWLNGTRILSRDVPRGAAPDQDRAPLDLVAGENRLLIKVHNQRGGHGFYFQLSQDPVVRVWEQIAALYPAECKAMARDLPAKGYLRWFRSGEGAAVGDELVTRLLEQTDVGSGVWRERVELLRAADASDDDPRWLDVYEHLRSVRSAQTQLDAFDLVALRRAVEDLTRSWPEQYDPRYLEQLAEYELAIIAIREDLHAGDLDAAFRGQRQLDELAAFRRTALLSNPVLDFDEMLIVRRRADSPALGLPQNWQGNCSLPRTGYEDVLCRMELRRDGLSPVRPVYTPDEPSILADIDVHWDGDRLLFSSLGSHDRWQIFEMTLPDMSVRQVTPGIHDDVENYDACYLPDGRIMFASTRCFQGIPCVGGADAVANLYLLNESDESIRQLCFDQDHNWCPTVLNNGRVLFTRWEYSDTPHYFTRLLMHMNPDGTSQMQYYGSNSYWPNSIFYARPIPGHPTKVVGIVSGHHGVRRMGELIIFDPMLGRFEADGVVQRIPGYGEEVEPIIKDQLVDDSWPRFLHPYPLSEKHFIVSCQPQPGASWGVYLVDIYDNMLLLAEDPSHALLEPIPVKPSVAPPVIPDKVRLAEKNATIFLSDVYHGPGLDGVPRGTVTDLRVYAFHYSYNNMGGHRHVGVEGPWDIHRLLGTVPVFEDGSTSFQVPANTPIAIQPLDKDGGALQLMRSWFTAMPGEVLSCVGCHESQNTVSPVRSTIAASQPPVAIEPWRGPARGFSFSHEVQPVLDRLCVGCHGGGELDGASPNLARSDEAGWGNFTPAYLALHPYVRRPGPEADYHLLEPMEFHANTSELMQMLRKGHHGVQLDDEARDRLVTWIDLNVPDHGTWADQGNIPGNLDERRREMAALYANVTDDPETPLATSGDTVEFIAPESVAPVAEGPLNAAGWPFDVAEAQRRRDALDLPATRTISLKRGLEMELALIPDGEFVMGSAVGFPDEAPRSVVRIDKPFYMATLEVTCAQFEQFDPVHFNGYHDQRHKDHTRPGYTAHGTDRPAIRISWEEAMAFCAWLSKETGLTCTLPTEAQWEWACRAGTGTALSYGDLDTDFAPFANLADLSVRKLAVTGVDPHPIANPNAFQDYLPKDDRFDDGERLMADAGQYRPNAWGLYDMHGNVCEWTRSDYRPYPYDGYDGRNDGGSGQNKVVRGGSWRDRPKLARSAWRLDYRSYQRVYNVGFRIVVQP